MTNGLLLSIIIVNWNTREYLAKCLQSVEQDMLTLEPYAALSSSALNVETFVVDNASTDGSTQMVREQFPWVQIISNLENVGFARANNQAIYQSTGRYILLLNSDTEVYPGALAVMVQFMEANPQVGGCGPKLLNADSSLQTSCHPVLTPEREFWRLMFLDRIWRRATYLQQKWDPVTPHKVEVIKGACFLLRRQALEQVGLLDEQYFMYTEEMDLCYRLLQTGWELWWVPQAVVKHYGEASTRQIAAKMYVQLYRSKAQFHRKYGGERKVRLFKRLLRMAYTPRWALVALGSLVMPSLEARASIYRRLLRELAAL